MDACPMTHYLSYSACWQHPPPRWGYETSLEHMHKMSKEGRECNPEKKRRGKNRGHDRSFCSACHCLWSLYEAWSWCQLLPWLCVGVHGLHMQKKQRQQLHVSDPVSPTPTPRTHLLWNLAEDRHLQLIQSSTDIQLTFATVKNGCQITGHLVRCVRNAVQLSARDWQSMRP